jgi:hypothetical protein
MRTRDPLIITLQKRPPYFHDLGAWDDSPIFPFGLDRLSVWRARYYIRAKRARRALPRSPATAEGLEAALQRKLSAIDRRSPEGLAAATHSFFETVLVAEFGAGLLTGPGFGEVLSERSVSLRQEAELREPLARLLGEF